MLRKLGRELLWAAMMVFVFIPSLIAGMNKANEQIMHQMVQLNRQQLDWPRAVAPAPNVPDETRPLILPRR